MNASTLSIHEFYEQLCNELRNNPALFMSEDDQEFNDLIDIRSRLENEVTDIKEKITTSEIDNHENECLDVCDKISLMLGNYRDISPIIGDMREIYSTMLNIHDRTYCNIWYYKETFSLVFPKIRAIFLKLGAVLLAAQGIYYYYQSELNEKVASAILNQIRSLM